MTSTMLVHAHNYADQGLEVFPLRPDKTPYTTHGHNEASSDPFTVERWWKQWPDALIGCRIPRDMIVLDIDIRHGGGDAWAALEAEAGTIPTGRVHWSGRGDGGRHLWFRRPDGPLSMRAMHAWAKEHGVGHAITATKWSCGIDLLHHGHRYTILPPSIHADSGNPYTWGDSALSDPPGELHPYVVALLHREPDVVAPTPERERGTSSADSPMDWYRASHTWRSLLGAHGWTVVSGDGDHDGSRWRHPLATASYSATIKHGCLFVYSPNTPFDETADGEPRGYTLGRAYAVLEHDGDLTRASRSILDMRDGPRAQRQRDDDFTWIEPAKLVSTIVDVVDEDDPLPTPIIDWTKFWARSRKPEWFCAPFLAEGRGHAIYAKGGTGKSLVVLTAAINMSTGRSVFGQPAGRPRRVLYLDYEMTEDDVEERLAAVGFGERDDLSCLHYALLPTLPPLDTREGAQALLTQAERLQSELVVIDTFSRAVQGEENDADTVRNYYRMTGMALKARGITSLRIDHVGKESDRGARGSSAKLDDVDVVWELRRADDGYTLVNQKRRMGWVPEKIALRMAEDPLSFSLVDSLWPTGTMQTVAFLEHAGVTASSTIGMAKAALNEAGTLPPLVSKRQQVVSAALRYMRQRDTSLVVWDDTKMGGNNPGNNGYPQAPEQPREQTPEMASDRVRNNSGTARNNPTDPIGNSSPPIRGNSPEVEPPEHNQSPPPEVVAPVRPTLDDLDW
jgi:hypothetical protein